jgi:hypothetical protein
MRLVGCLLVLYLSGVGCAVISFTGAAIALDCSPAENCLIQRRSRLGFTSCARATPEIEMPESVCSHIFT